MTLHDALIQQLRAQFPALDRTVDGRPAVFLDGPAGTQVPRRVADAISDYLLHCNANRHGLFATAIESDELIEKAHAAAADLVGASDPSTIAFGANMTSLTFALSRAIAKTWQPGDEIVLSRLEHDANFTPWVLAARDAGVIVRYVDIDPESCTLRIEQYETLIHSKTRLVAVGCASNAVGTINPVKQICEQARQYGALTFLDAVHFAPHDLIDVVDWQCDFLACSAYKFFGPHVGVMYGRRELLQELQPYKLRPAPDDLPGRWMTGTQNFECVAGTMAAIEYIADIGREVGDDKADRRDALRTAFGSIRQYERGLLDRMIDGLSAISGVKVWGITDPEKRSRRFPTVSITHENVSPQQLAKRLAAQGVFVWHGNYYALPLTESLGVEPAGMVRLGAVHYNTHDEIEHMLDSVKDAVSSSA